MSNTNYDDECTQFINTETNPQESKPAVDNSQPNSTIQSSGNGESTANEQTPNSKKSGKISLKRVAGGFGFGVVVGAASGTFSAYGRSVTPESAVQESEESETPDDSVRPEWADDQVSIATEVNDDMSFSEAFATARAEVGAGGVFEWHGQVYGTYTAEEWNAMTLAERAEFENHFNWNHISTSPAHSDMAHAGNTDEIEIVNVEHSEDANVHEVAMHEENVVDAQDVAIDAVEPEIEILGVVHDSETGANIGGLAVDGQEVIVIDVNGDMEFDYMASDLNGNGQIDEGEVADIHGQGFGVNDLGGFSSPEGLLANDDITDATTDGLYEV